MEWTNDVENEEDLPDGNFDCPHGKDESLRLNGPPKTLNVKSGGVKTRGRFRDFD